MCHLFIDNSKLCSKIQKIICSCWFQYCQAKSLFSYAFNASCAKNKIFPLIQLQNLKPVLNFNLKLCLYHFSFFFPVQLQSEAMIKARRKKNCYLDFVKVQPILLWLLQPGTSSLSRLWTNVGYLSIKYTLPLKMPLPYPVTKFSSSLGLAVSFQFSILLRWAQREVSL